MKKEAPDLIPQQIVNGKYIVLAKIGEGAYGKVYEVVEKKKESVQVVLKIQNVTLCSDSYQTELEMMRACSGSAGFPHLLDNFIDIKDEETYASLVMTQEGESYRHVLQRKNCKLSPSNVLRIGWMFFRALIILHRNGFVHNDLHCGNILVKRDRGGNVVVTLIDFGCSTSENSPDSLGNSYSRFYDYRTMSFILGRSVGMTSFSEDTKTPVQNKQDLNANLSSHSTENKTQCQWITSLMSLFNRQSREGYDYGEISRLFHNALPDTKPESRIENNLELTPQTIVNGQYVVQDKIGEGNFGKIYEIVTRENRYDTLVLKVQNCTFDTRSYRRELDVLRRCRGSQGFPFLMDAFSETTGGQVYKFLVMTPEGELYLDALRRKDFKLTSANVLRIGWMIFRALTTLHQHGLVHHDIHYGNVLVKRDWAGDVVITLIDFGRSTPESSPNNRLHQVRFQTTLSYAMGNPYSRFDDLMAMGYLLGPSVGVHPFVSEEQTTVQTKEDFHADPTSYFPDDNTQWIPALIKLFERQREEGYNYSAISRVFHDAIPNIEPESFVEYKVTNGDLYID